MPDVFYAMKRENSDDINPDHKTNNDTNNDAQLRQRKNISSASNPNDFRNPRNRGKTEEYYSTDSTENESDTDKEAIKRAKLQKNQLTKSQKFWKRFYSTWTMIFGFFLIIYIGHTALCLLVTVFQALGFREIAGLGSKPRKEKQLPNFYLLHWHFFLTSIFFLYGQLLMEHLLIGVFIGRNVVMEIILRHHGFISFMLIVVGIISFVISLKKGFYKYQFKQLGWCMAIIIIVVVQSTFVMRNIMDGIIWFFVPASAIITNDIMAYMCGRAFGKKFISTPLIKLSPNKTWEGAIGACFFTVLFTYGFATFLIDYQFFVCPKHGFGFTYPQCEPDITFIKRDMEIFGFTMNVAPFQLHSLIFALYASLIGPFGGFFASGFKRAFKLKDFSQSVGFGHGGISDRMDCQIMMCVFVYVYRQSFVVGTADMIMGVSQITQNILQLSKDDQMKLLENLKQIVNERGGK